MNPSRSLRVASVQFESAPGDKDANFKKIEQFVAEAVRRLLRESPHPSMQEEVARINEVVDELNREAEDVLEYQVIS